jgi:peptidoglycan/LPS O-acetylase OafA/YrhL
MAGAAAAGVFGAEPIFSGGLPALILFMLLWRLPADRIHRNFYGLVILGDASYALYLSHPFTLTIMKLAMKSLHVAELGMPVLTIIYCTAAMAAAVGAAILFYVLLERPVTVRLQTYFLPRPSR